jgi:glycosyltransferase involved in cell wall biosynthesis
MTADVCLVVEGTYPYVAGGVSSWLHALITNLPEFSFHLVHLGSRPDPTREMRYTLPANVVGLDELYLHDVSWTKRRPRRRWRRRNAEVAALWRALGTLHEAFSAETPHDSEALLRQLGTYAPRGLDTHELLYSRDSWDMLVRRYRERAPDSSFIDFFWTFRFTHLPILYLLDAPLPPARLYHPVSGGPASFLAALGTLRTGRPTILTEHGIYTREREIEIAQAQWIHSEVQEANLPGARLGFFQSWWTNMFRYMTKFSYDIADQVISITNGNQRFQLEIGADRQKMIVISNGIDIERLRGLRTMNTDVTDTFTVGFVGRVVPIKDVKTFLRAIRLAASEIPNLRVFVVGPTDEDPDYYLEIEQLVIALGIGAQVTFTGRADVRDYYKLMDVLVLTSLSEAQPLVLLEANCAGVPAVSTDVGACRELLEGGASADRALGPSGLLTPVSSPRATADALIMLARDPELRARMAHAGQERVETFYREDAVYAAYRSLYLHHIAAAGR